MFQFSPFVGTQILVKYFQLVRIKVQLVANPVTASHADLTLAPTSTPVPTHATPHLSPSSSTPAPAPAPAPTASAQVGMLLRKAAMAGTPVMTITQEDGGWKIHTKTTAKSMDYSFK